MKSRSRIQKEKQKKMFDSILNVCETPNEFAYACAKFMQFQIFMEINNCTDAYLFFAS